MKSLAKVSGTLSSTTSPNDVIDLDVSELGGIGIQITGSFTATMQFKGSTDGTNYAALKATPAGSSTAVTSATAAGIWQASCSGLLTVRVQMSSHSDGSAVITLLANEASLGGGGSSGGGGGGGDASADNQVLEIAALDKLAAQTLDYDTGAGTAATAILGMALPASGGPVAGGTTTNPINVALPAATVSTLTPPTNTGYATSAKQDTGNTSVASIDTKTPALGQALAAASVPVVLTAAQIITLTPVSTVAVSSISAGNNNIGDVDVASIAAGNNNIGDVDVASIAAGDNNIGNVDIVTVPTDPYGVNADAASATGSISAKLRGIATALGITALDLGTGTGGSRTLRFFSDTAQWIGGAGSVSSATQRVTLPTDDPAVAVLGTTAGAAVITDANGTIQQYLRGIVKLLITSGTIILGAGTNAIGKLAANSGVDIGDVDVTSTKIDYAASSALTIGLGSLAASATWVAGRESGSYDNSSTKYPSIGLSGTIMTGTTPTAGEIRVYVVPALDDTPTWPDVFDGTDSAETVTSAAILDACGVLAARMVTSTTSNQAYPFRCVNIASLFGGFMPKKFVVFVTHSTVAVLHATAGNHIITVTPMLG